MNVIFVIKEMSVEKTIVGGIEKVYWPRMKLAICIACLIPESLSPKSQMKDQSKCGCLLLHCCFVTLENQIAES